MVYGGVQDQLLLANREIQRLSSELDQRNKKITTLDLESSNNVDKIQRLENELEKFRMMNSDLEQKMREHDRDKDQLLMQIGELKEKLLSSTKQEVKIDGDMTNQVTIINMEIEMYKQQVKDLRKELQDSEDVCSFLQNQIKELNLQNE